MYASILITTSHRPSYRTRSFVKDLSSVLPGSTRTHRGKKTLLHLAFEAKTIGARHVIVVGEKKGNPSLLRVYKVSPTIIKNTGDLIKHKASIVLRGVRLSREIPGSHRTYNPQTINVDPTNCVSNGCFVLSDILLELLEPCLSPEPDITIVLEEKGVIQVKFINRTGRLCGPLLKVSKVKIVEG